MPSSVHHPRYVALQEQLKTMRETAGMTQSDLAAALRVGQSFVSKIERGERYVDVLFYIEWCRACETDPSQSMKVLLAATS